MLKKIDRAQLFLEKHLELFQCPVCREPFTAVANHHLTCHKGHRFDLSKKGTLHLMLKSPESDYTRSMLEARQRIAQAGFWHPLLDNLLTRIKDQTGALLDVGGGEGSHSAYLKQQGLSGPLISFDISKEGVNLAAASHEDVFFLVADLAQSPFASDQYTTLLNILSPSNYSEFKRLLKPGGQVIKVVPNAGYLKELRAVKGDKAQTYSNKQVVDKFSQHFDQVTSETVYYSFRLTPDQIDDFIHMTPLGWHVKKKDEKIHTLLEEITVDLTILTGEIG
ncbi:Ribosomal RNA large subunit methyltransferase A [Alkalibacterium sp. AK22]|uniref:putative RNA methyltransferase n=1 Tax=Alkalibacterium sp. AK22 TaxID=1229520 RepID=UPI000452A924|nr:methyltransferase domain-containing protein [Alkalibacterium sp. AK22]EXJ22433.1 Ribosomal RNA large subunit methyltransferase A [Alkalibacterium sp. AK22]